MQMHAGDVCGKKGVRQVCCLQPLVGEDHDPALLPGPDPEILQVFDEHLDTLHPLVRNPPQNLLDAGTRTTLVLAVVPYGEVCYPLLPQDPRAQLPDLLRHRRAEEQRLAARARLRHVASCEDLCAHDLETLFQHLVRLVKNNALHEGQGDLAAVHEVDQAARRCTKDVDLCLLDPLLLELQALAPVDADLREARALGDDLDLL
mmetsp:Transcript_9291/g.26097  ORF Transcript_9291/g.26097 Transcript_9291/m.26097 type:complete len:204 (+) Transcript_9291:441-1052(+)